MAQCRHDVVSVPGSAAEHCRDWCESSRAIRAALGMAWLRPVRSACTAAAACGYGTGVGVSAAADATGGVHGFPAELTSFVGRAGSAREVASLLAEHRLVTVTGPGGVGKTRLAGQVARQVADRFADGAWLAGLAPTGGPAQVPGVVAAALGVREQPGVPAGEALARVLARRQLLLVLDNCEHLIGAAAELCAGLLAACDDVRVLATSREPLAVAGEARYRLGPLTLPGGDARDEAGGSEAVALFADRACRADAQFTLDGQTGPAVARLVARLDGMPLAIELAAARVEALGAVQLLDRLDDRFGLLAGGNRLAPGRHRSLAATVEWSYRLLGEDERRVFRTLSVFPGPFTLEAAEAVTRPGAAAVVLRLVDCSLLVPPREGSDGRWRYGMLETLRAYGTRLLAESGQRDQAAGALAGWAADVAGQAAAGLQSAEGELAAARWLDAEDAAMRQVLAWAMDHDPDVAVRLAVALVPWWYLRGRLTEQYPLLRQVAGRATPGSDRWCAAQYWLGMAASGSADPVVALGHFTVVFDTIGDRGASRALVDALTGRAWNLTNMGRTAEAAEAARGALAMAREAGYPSGEALSLVTLSRIAMAADDPGSAVRLARQAGQVTAGIPGWVVRLCSLSLTEVLIAAGEMDAAEDMCAAGLVLSRDAGSLDDLADILNLMTILDLSAGRIADAAAHLREAVQVALRTGYSNVVINSLDCCGLLCAATGRPAEAMTAWAASAAHTRHQESLDWPAEERRREGPLRRARQALGPGRTRPAEERGAAMSLETAAEYALMLTDPGPPQRTAPGAGSLSARERELVTLVAQGYTDAQIAARLYISIRTVRSHLDRIRDKTGCRRRADLTRLALAERLV
jgi:predicted ATPase/DNA-binding CsgD family transcriptional regulator